VTLTEHDADALTQARAKIKLIHTVHERLKGTGLDIRELAKELVISHPGHPEHGRLYINLATAEVSHRLPTCTYLGYLDGYGTDRDPDEPRVDTNKIITTLTRPGSASIPPPPGPPGDL
jgi:hypothetical protein